MSTECWLRADADDGNDPIEATVTLGHRPVRGDLIEVWNAEGGYWNFSIRVPCPVCEASAGTKCVPVGDERDRKPQGGHVWHAERTKRGGDSAWLEVEKVVLSAYGDPDSDALEVWVKMDTYDREELVAVMAAAGRGDAP